MSHSISLEMLPSGMLSSDLINIQESGYFGQNPIKQAASPLILQYSRC